MSSSFTDLILATVILALLCLFWGASFRRNDNVKILETVVVDFDGQIALYIDITPLVRPFVTAAVNNMLDKGGLVLVRTS